MSARFTVEPMEVAFTSMLLGERAVIAAMAAKDRSRALAGMALLRPGRSAVVLAFEYPLLFCAYARMAGWGGRCAEEVARLFPPDGCRGPQDVEDRVSNQFFVIAAALCLDAIRSEDVRRCADYACIAIDQARATPWRAACLLYLGQRMQRMFYRVEGEASEDDVLRSRLLNRLCALLKGNGYEGVAEVLGSIALMESDATAFSETMSVVPLVLPPPPPRFSEAGLWDVPD